MVFVVRPRTRAFLVRTRLEHYTARRCPVRRLFAEVSRFRLAHFDVLDGVPFDPVIPKSRVGERV